MPRNLARLGPLPPLRVYRGTAGGNYGVILETERGRMVVSDSDVEDYLPAVKGWLRANSTNYTDPREDVFASQIDPDPSSGEYNRWTEVLEWIYSLMKPERYRSWSQYTRYGLLLGADPLLQHYQNYLSYDMNSFEAEEELGYMAGFFCILSSMHDVPGIESSLTSTIIDEIWELLQRWFPTIADLDPEGAFAVVDSVFRMTDNSTDCLKAMLELLSPSIQDKLLNVAEEMLNRGDLNDAAEEIREHLAPST